MSCCGGGCSKGRATEAVAKAGMGKRSWERLGWLDMVLRSSDDEARALVLIGGMSAMSVYWSE